MVAVFVYAGNDMMDRPFDPLSLPPLIDELPAPSLLGAVAPRTTWLVANRLRFSEIGRTNKDIPGEDALLNEWTRSRRPSLSPRSPGTCGCTTIPSSSEETIAEILLRGSGRLHKAARNRTHDREYLGGWLLSGIIDWETGSWAVPRDAEEAVQMAGDAKVGETLSWLQAMDRLVSSTRQASAGRPDPRRNRRPRLCRVLAPVAAILLVLVVAPMQDIVDWRRRFDRTGCRWWICARSSTAFVAPIA